MKYVVEIEEVLQKRIVIDSDEVESKEDAELTAEDLYDSGEVELDSSNLVDTSFRVCDDDCGTEEMEVF